MVSSENIPWIVDIEDTRSEVFTEPFETNIFSRTSEEFRNIFKNGLIENKNLIINHLNNRKKEDWSLWNEYFNLIKVNPIEIIDNMLNILNNLS